MATRATTSKTCTQKTTSKTTSSGTRKSNSQAQNEHLIKANRAMGKAWDSISRRQGKRG